MDAAFVFFMWILDQVCEGYLFPSVPPISCQSPRLPLRSAATHPTASPSPSPSQPFLTLDSDCACIPAVLPDYTGHCLCCTATEYHIY